MGDRLFKPKVVAGGGIQLPAGAGAGLIAVSDASGNISWQSGAPPGGAAGGGLTGTYPNPQVQGFSDAWLPGITADRFGNLVVNSTTQVTVKVGVFWVLDTSAILTRCSSSGGGDTILGSIPAASAGNFRLDQLVVDSTGVVSRLAGTQGAAVTLDNRTGAAAIPNGSMLLWDLLVTSTGVTLANSWDRRAWAAPGTSTANQTSLPTAITGREIKFVADAANGVVWHLRARLVNPDGSRNTSAFPWDYVGGGWLTDEGRAAAASGLTANVWSTIDGTVDPTITVPLAGDWEVDHSTSIIQTTDATVTGAFVGVKVGATDPNNALTPVCNVDSGHWGNMRESLTLTGLAASTVLLQRYQVNRTVLTTRRASVLRVRPVRVG